MPRSPASFCHNLDTDLTVLIKVLVKSRYLVGRLNISSQLTIIQMQFYLVKEGLNAVHIGTKIPFRATTFLYQTSL